jgi:uncharacterized membrane protein
MPFTYLMLNGAHNVLFFLLLIPLVIWEAIWKGIGLWKSAKNSQLAWFVAILIINSLGILPIVYLLYFQAKAKNKSKKL